ncbi:OmpA family protein [Dyella monticola]|nr:OmpA family protein [Dyella monticola]
MLKIKGSAVFLLLAVLVGERAFATDLDFKGIFFKEGLPSVGGDLAGSTVMFDDYAVPVLKDDSAAFLNLKSNAKVKIVGFTDNQECQRDICKALSLRRAQLVNAWLLAHDFPADRLLAPEGHGSSDPIDTNATADGRQRNRRAEFQIIAPPGQP